MDAAASEVHLITCVKCSVFFSCNVCSLCRGHGVGSDDSSLVPELLAIGVVMSTICLPDGEWPSGLPAQPAPAMPENLTAPMMANVTSSQKIVVSIGPDSRNGYNFTFVYPSDFTPDAPEVIIAGETEEEKEKRQKRIPPLSPWLQVDIARAGEGVLNWTYTNPPPVPCLPSPGAEVLNFVLAHTKAQSVNDGVADHVLKEIEKLRQRVGRVESSESDSNVQIKTGTVTKKRPREKVESPDREQDGAAEEASRG